MRRLLALMILASACEAQKQAATAAPETPTMVDTKEKTKEVVDTGSDPVVPVVPVVAPCQDNEITGHTFKNIAVHNGMGDFTMVVKADCTIEMPNCNQVMHIPEHINVNLDQTINVPVTIETTGYFGWDTCHAVGTKSCTLTYATFDGRKVLSFACGGGSEFFAGDLQ